MGLRARFFNKVTWSRPRRSDVRSSDRPSFARQLSAGMTPRLPSRRHGLPASPAPWDWGDHLPTSPFAPWARSSSRLPDVGGANLDVAPVAPAPTRGGDWVTSRASARAQWGSSRPAAGGRLPRLAAAKAPAAAPPPPLRKRPSFASRLRRGVLPHRPKPKRSPRASDAGPPPFFRKARR
jgi:hypothetical protein